MTGTFGVGGYSPVRKYLSANSTAADFSVSIGQAASVPAGFVPLKGHIGLHPVRAVGTGSSGHTFTYRILGAWRQDNGDAGEWDIEVIATVVATLGNTTGASGRLVSNTERYAWSQAVTDGPVAVAYPRASPVVSDGDDADGTRSVLSIADLGQPDYIGFDFDMGTASSGNVLFGLVT